MYPGHFPRRDAEKGRRRVRTLKKTSDIMGVMEADHPELHGFSLRYKDGWAVLIVPPKHARPRPVYADDVAARMKILGIPSVPAKRIRDVIAEGSGEAVPMVEWPAGETLNSRVTVTVDEDGMAARVEVTPARPGGAPADRRTMQTALERAGVVRGLKEDAVDAVLARPAAGKSVVIAAGKPAKDGRERRTECLFVTERIKPWKEISGGRIDLKDLHFIQNRKAGDLLARDVPAVPPEDGYDVFGGVIEAPPQPPERLLAAGDGVRSTDEGLVATIDGNVLIENGAVRVEPSVTVKNVDYSTGNIDFDGSVAVEGTVADGFTVRATGDVQIGKTVGRSRVSAGRNLILRAGLVGDDEGFCEAGGSLYARFIESAKAVAAENLIVTEAVLHSETDVDGDMMVNEGRGEIFGGVTIVGGSLACKKIGNIYAGNTKVFVGCPPGELRSFHELGVELTSSKDAVDDLERQLDYLRAKNGTAAEIAALEGAVATRREALKEGAVRLKAMKAALKASDGTSVTVSDRIFPGVVLSFGLEEYPLGDKGLERAVLRRESGRTVMHGYLPENRRE